MKRALLIIMTVFMGCLAQAQTTTEGTDFWFGFMENSLPPGGQVFLEIYISSKFEANVEVSSQGTFQRSLNIQPGTTEKIDVPINFMPTDEGKFNLGLQVTSDEPVTVYQLNKRQFSADAAVILPKNALGKEYYVTAHMEPFGEQEDQVRESEFLVVAAEDGTEVEITPSRNTYGGWTAGVAQTITLDAGEVYLVKSDEDLSGSYVRTINADENECKNVAVFGGNVFTNVGGCGGFRDHLIEQMFPVSTWGKEFLYVPYTTRLGGDYIKIIASEDNTIITISNFGNITLNAGDVYRNKALEGVRTITSTKPISLAQYSRSSQCDFRDGDPFMIIVSPIEQRVTEATFSAFTVLEISQYYLTLITESSALQEGVFLDNSSITEDFTLIGKYAYASLQITQGDHTIRAPGGVIAYVYGYGQAESFGYSAGVSLENLNLEIMGDDEFIGTIEEQACVNAVIDFEAAFETEPGQQPRYDTFSWDFGDGNTGDGQSIQHTYTAPGEYVVTILASNGSASCGNSETLNRSIVITDTEVEEIFGPVSVCPDVTDIVYKIEGADDNTYQWTVNRGTITSGQGTNEITVDWAGATDLASVNVTPFNALGCQSDELSLGVVINKRLEPAIPRSSSPQVGEVCYLDRNSVRYFTSPTNGSEYEWFVEGGTLLSGQSTNEIMVDWGDNASGKVWYREFNPLISDCEGFSDDLNVVIYPEIVESGIVGDALCNGEANGTIVLTIAGGKEGDYIVNWDNGMTGPSISGLVAATYTATISDVLGCEITSRTYLVNQPDVLEFVGTAEVLDVRCFEESNGEILVSVQGGTEPYLYAWSGEGVATTTNIPQLTGLKTGTYQVEVTDANGCLALLEDIFVGEPLLLEADLETLINEPVCPQAEDGIAFIDAKGGTPDYQFFWSNAPTTNDAETRGLAKGEYTVRIVDANGCEISYIIEKGERDPKVFVPNAFSPNGDEVNDEFKPVADCPVTYSIQIFNKWGSIVFSTNDITEGWDGTFGGAPVQAGKYSYVIFWAATINEVRYEENLRGSVNIYK